MKKKKSTESTPLRAMNKNTLHFYLLSVLIILMAGCKKDFKNAPLEITLDEQVEAGPIPPYLFDWEITTYMPSPTPGNQIQMPWNSGTTAIDPNIVSDYKKADGWEMVWNTFSPTTALNDPSYTYFFALYNRYRGILRYYLWQSASSVATSYVNHGLSLYTSGATSSMLNYNSIDIVDPTTNQSAFAQILKQQINSAGGTWFAFQYEIAYDPNIANLSFPSFGITWNPRWANVSNITLNGTQSGTIEGYIGNPAQNSFGFGSILQQGVLTFLGGLNYTQILSAVDANNPSKPYETALNNSLGSIVKGLLNAVLGGSSSVQAVNMTIKTEIQLGGNLVSNGGLTDMKLVLPGQSNSQTADGNIPAYDNIMGVFNISNKPTVNAYVSSYTTGPWEDPWDGSTYYNAMYETSYNLDNNSYNVIWNPAIINSSTTGAEIQNLKTEIIALSKISQSMYPGGNFVFTGSPQQQIDGGPSGSVYIYLPNGYGTIENIGNYSAAVSIPNSSTPLLIDVGSRDIEGLAIRISFDVVPNNGAPSTKIVKSFLPNIVYH